MMESLVIWVAVLTMQALALLAASLGGYKTALDKESEAGGYYLAAIALGLLSMLLVVTT